MAYASGGRIHGTPFRSERQRASAAGRCRRRSHRRSAQRHGLLRPQRVHLWRRRSRRLLYRVTSGAVRSYKVLRDGRRQIAAFYLVDDIFGVEASREHRLSAEAIRPTRAVAYLHRCSEAALFGSDDRLYRDVVTSTVSDLGRAHRHAILLGRKTATEKMATFLLDIAARMNSDTFELPMSRLDIADYLGLTIETVARTMAKLARDCIISMQNGRRTITLHDKAALYRLREAD